MRNTNRDTRKGGWVLVISNKFADLAPAGQDPMRSGALWLRYWYVTTIVIKAPGSAWRPESNY